MFNRAETVGAVIPIHSIWGCDERGYGALQDLNKPKQIIESAWLKVGCGGRAKALAKRGA